MNLIEQYKKTRKYTETLCQPLQTEDYVVQPVVDVSPPKWHLGHTTWFFETFLLLPFAAGYHVFDNDFNYVFNSYYETIGNRIIRTDRGNLSRPVVSEVYQYRRYVDDAVKQLLSTRFSSDLEEIITLGINHEQQHQELLMTDIKYILGHNPLFPVYSKSLFTAGDIHNELPRFITFDEGIHEIGYVGNGFCFDNERNRHKVYLNKFSIRDKLVTNAEYTEFINGGGYRDFNYWHAEGWDWVKNNQISAPMYWHRMNEQWYSYTLSGLVPLALDKPVTHVSYYEAYAFATWKEMRLPTEFEWEVAAEQLDWGLRWEWTESAYLPYPGFTKAPGAIGEYNGKFMVNQKVLRGASCITPKGHSRISYRNFFHPHLRWQFTGIRLAR